LLLVASVAVVVSATRLKKETKLEVVSVAVAVSLAALSYTDKPQPA